MHGVSRAGGPVAAGAGQGHPGRSRRGPPGPVGAARIRGHTGPMERLP